MDKLLQTRAEETPPVQPSASTSRAGSQQEVGQYGDSLALQASFGWQRTDTASLATDVFVDGLVTLDRAEDLLSVYRSNMATHFPFVVIGPDASVQHLRDQKPFLLLSVLASAAFNDLSLQKILGSVVKQAINDRLLWGKNLTFEVLQGLLVFLAWYGLTLHLIHYLDTMWSS